MLFCALGCATGADLRLGIVGTDTSHAVAFAKLLQSPDVKSTMAGVRIVAAYKGGSPDVESSHTRVDKYAEELNTQYQVEIVPDIPTLVESGFPSLDAPTWFGVVVRTPTPAPVLARLRTEFNAVITSEGYAKALERNSMEVLAVPPDVSDQFLAKERKLWSDAVKVTGVALD